MEGVRHVGGNEVTAEEFTCRVAEFFE